MSNSSQFIRRKDFFEELLFKNLTAGLLTIFINYVNGSLLYTYFTNPTLNSHSRYILYIQLIFNDMILLSLADLLIVLGYLCPFMNVSVCISLLLIANNTFKNTPLNLACMAIERFVAICYPLHHPSICTVSRTYILIACIWIVGGLPGFADVIITFAFNPLSYFSTSKLCYQSNVFNSVYHFNNSYITNIIYMSFVWITLIYTYFKVMFSAKAAASDPTVARKAQKTILLHGVQLLLCMLSFITPMVDAGLSSLFPNFRSVIFFCTYIVTIMLPRLLSPLIYGLRDQKFKRHMKGSLLCRRTKPTVNMTT